MSATSCLTAVSLNAGYIMKELTVACQLWHGCCPVERTLVGDEYLQTKPVRMFLTGRHKGLKTETGNPHTSASEKKPHQGKLQVAGCLASSLDPHSRWANWPLMRGEDEPSSRRAHTPIPSGERWDKAERWEGTEYLELGHNGVSQGAGRWRDGCPTAAAGMSHGCWDVPQLQSRWLLPVGTHCMAPVHGHSSAHPPFVPSALYGLRSPPTLRLPWVILPHQPTALGRAKIIAIQLEAFGSTTQAAER